MRQKLFAIILYSNIVGAVFLLCLLVFPSIVSAQVVINELGVLGTSGTDSTDWVEVYNYSPDPIDLSSYKIIDEANNELNLTGLLGSEEWKDFTWSNRLNNSGDIVWLVEVDGSEEEEVEEIRYGEKGGVCLPPTGDGSIGKITDGGNVTVMFSKSSKGVSNSLGNLEPCPTPTPVPTATFTPTPKPTSAPKPTATPRPTKTPTPKVTSTPTPTKMETLSEEESGEMRAGGTYKEGGDNDVVLGLRNELNGEKDSEGDEEGEEGKKFPIAAVLLVLGGLGFVGAASYPLYKDKLKIYNLTNVFKKGKRRRPAKISFPDQEEAG